MYTAKQSESLKHLDFLFFDLMTTELSFFAASGIRNGFRHLINSNVYMSVAVVLALLYVCVAFFIENYDGILRRGRLVELVAIMAMVVYSYIETGHWRKIKARSLLKNSLIILAVFILFWVVYRNSVNVQNQVMRLFERFGELSTGDDQGTGRHALYFFATLRLELLDIPIIQKLFGVGNQCGGILLTYYSGSIDWVGLLPSMKDLTHIWTVESDLASIFLESGILGAFFYYGFYYSAFSKSKGNIKSKRSVFRRVT